RKTNGVDARTSSRTYLAANLMGAICNPPGGRSGPPWAASFPPFRRLADGDANRPLTRGATDAAAWFFSAAAHSGAAVLLSVLYGSGQHYAPHPAGRGRGCKNCGK
ncbi:MAG: hypothetical protein DRO87_11690, partial [Candidatus Thorarchaeota archaeon]